MLATLYLFPAGPKTSFEVLKAWFERERSSDERVIRGSFY
jgi:hypothetical protein